MKRNYGPFLVVIAVLLVIVIGVYYISNRKVQSNVVSTNQPQENLNVKSKQLFSDSIFAQNSYLISTPTYDANTEKALTGFKVTKSNLSDGSVQYVLNSQNKEYVTQTYVVKPGEKLYFIESNLSDDSGTEDKYPGDDTAVLVDASGYILN